MALLFIFEMPVNRARVHRHLVFLQDPNFIISWDRLSMTKAAKVHSMGWIETFSERNTTNPDGLDKVKALDVLDC
jgi:hypothetical protein